MFVNNGFTFLNIKGVYKFDGNIIVPLYEYGLTPVYSPHVKQDKIIFYEFLALDGKDKDSIIRFTNKYGLLFHGNIIENNNNNYLFFNDQKEQFSQVISANRYEITYQHYSEVITFCQKFMDLITATTDLNLKKMIESIAFFLFAVNCDDRYMLDGRFELGDWRFSYPYTKKKCNDNFIASIEHFEEKHLESIYADNPSYWQEKNAKSCLTEAFLTLSNYLIDTFGLENVSHSGELSVTQPITEELLQPLSDLILKTSYGIINDIFNYALQNISPVMKLEDNKLVGDWHIATLLEAMFFELYISLSQDIKVKKCPCCGAYFEVASTNNRKKYCSDTCNDRMAQRRRRAKAKQNK